MASPKRQTSQPTAPPRRFTASGFDGLLDLIQLEDVLGLRAAHPGHTMTPTVVFIRPLVNGNEVLRAVWRRQQESDVTITVDIGGEKMYFGLSDARPTSYTVRLLDGLLVEELAVQSRLVTLV